MSAVDLAALRAAAEAAKQHAPWWREPSLIVALRMSPTDAAHIAAASPAVVLALLDRLKRAEEALLPFARIWRVNAALSPDAARPVAQFIAGTWPTMGDAQRADAALGAPAP